jgi:pimeloyl-ACP methyl ester carboxylesterase
LSEVQKAFVEGKNLLLVEDVADADRFMSLMFVTPPNIPHPGKSYFAERAASARVFNEHIFGELGQRPFLLDGRLGEIRAPTLVLWGAEDRVLHASSAKVFAEGIPGAKLTLMPRTGHAPMIEHPEETARLVSEFVTTLQH